MVRRMGILLTLAAGAAGIACSDVGPKGYLSGEWTGGDIFTSIMFTVDRARLTVIRIVPNPSSGFNWYCAGLTSANAINAGVDLPIVNDSVHVVLPAGNWTATSTASSTRYPAAWNSVPTSS